jgi:small subunit ribosomal protein S21
VVGHFTGEELKVLVNNNQVEKAIRILRRKVDNNGTILRLRELQFYEKPAQKKQRLKNAAIRRQQKITNEYKNFTVRNTRDRRRSK